MSTSWKFYRTSEEAWEGMYDAASVATVSIDFEQYIFEEDEIGRRFADLFIKKVKEGVRVRLLADTVGSYNFFASIFEQELIRAGVQVKFFNVIKPWRFTNPKAIFFRDHRKLMVVDRQVALTGGVGIWKAFSGWRDTHVKLAGPIVTDLLTNFEQMWRNADQEKFIRFKNPRQTEDGFTVITNAPHFRQRFMNRTVLETIRNAQECIYITTPYLVPDRRFRRVLLLAALRGVDVNVLLPEKSNHPFVDRASHYYFKRVLEAGIKIHLYEKSMLHAKTIVVDGDWAVVGSSNIDNLSTYFNYELNIASTDSKFVDDLTAHFKDDLKFSHQLGLEEWKRRSFLRKFLEVISMPFGRFF